MFHFLRKSFTFKRHIFDAISPLTLPELICLQPQWLSARHCTSVTSNGRSFTVSYLIDTCGFSPQEAAAASERVSFESPERPDLVINFLKTQGLSQPQIQRVIREVPAILRFDPEKTFLPKIEFFISRGFSRSDIPKLICSCPSIMRRSLNKQLIPSFDFFRDFFQSDVKFIKTVKLYSGILVDFNTCTVPNIMLLRGVGVPQSNVIKLLQYYPKVMTFGHRRFKEAVDEVKELGINPSMVNFVLAVSVLASLSKSTWEKKVNVLKKWGLSEDDILTAFRKSSLLMKTSEDKIDAVMEFLVNKLGCESSIITKYPAIFAYSLNRRFFPRGAVIEVLLSKGLVGKEILPVIFTYTEGDFLKRVIMRHEKEASELLKLYQSQLELPRSMKNGKV